MRLAAYAGASVALAASVVIYAFNQRTNFYSACVYLAQSNLCLMILTNLILFCVSAMVFCLQRLFYGPLRPIEIEQLYEKAWFAITETCLAMTIFREEVGAWFLVMFVGLLVGKVWGWIGDGRVEVLEQQPPANPRLFHIRLSLSLGLSLLYDIWLLVYTINTVIQQARPNMMVMFLFELAVLTTSSFSTAIRYGISLVEARIIHQQTKERLEARRAEVRADRERIMAERANAAAAVEAGTAEASAEEPAELPSEDDVDEMDIEVPGWEAKGQYVLSLDLATDFIKLGILSAFFFILLTFYGLPIHIMRDLFLTARSFFKRLSAFVKYRRATRDMNSRYPDATVEEIQREDTCIICREEMRPWSVTNPVTVLQPGEAPPPVPSTINERQRPKKLPCGHVLHLGCLKSWLERQQVCPTCRNPVVDSANVGRHGAGNFGAPAGAPAPGQLQQPGQQGQQGDPQRRPPNMRQFGIGPIRFAFGQANLQDMVQGLNGAQPANRNGQPGAARMYGLEFGFPRRQAQGQGAAPAPQNAVTPTLQEQMQSIEQRITQEIQSLQVTQQEFQIINLLQVELERLRARQATGNSPAVGVAQTQLPLPPFVPGSFAQPAGGYPIPGRVQMPRSPTPVLQRHSVTPGVSALPAGSPDLPPGVVIPEGWSLLPLTRLGAISNGDLAPPQVIPTQPGPTTVETSSIPTNVSQDALSASTNQSSTSQIVAPTPTRLASEILSRSTPEPPATSIDTHNDSSSSSRGHPSILSDSSQVETTGAESNASPSVPQWGSGAHPLLSRLNAAFNNSTQPGPSIPQQQPSDATMISDQPSTVDDNSSPFPESAEESSDKGKAKAVTIEDTSDEDA